MILKDLIKSIDRVKSVNGTLNNNVNKICYDSRKVNSEEDLFVAINSLDDNALQFIPQAIENGSRVIVFDNKDLVDINELKKIKLDEEFTFIEVEDARVAMAQLSFKLNGSPQNKLKLFGITGTNGKTTISYLIKQIFENEGIKTVLIGTLGVMIENDFLSTGFTTPESPDLAIILNDAIEKGCKAVVMEVSSHALALNRVFGINFNGAIFSNITIDHLDFHKTFEEYLNTKLKLFQNLDSNGFAVINIDDNYGDKFVDMCKTQAITYGKQKETSARIENIKLELGFTRFDLIMKNGNCYNLQTKFTGEFNVYNVASVVALCDCLGFDKIRLTKAVSELIGVPGRMETFKSSIGFNVIVDYAHTPDAIENVLVTLRNLITNDGKIICVFGCGGDRDKSKRPLMGEVSSRLSDKVIVTSDNPRTENPLDIINEVVTGIIDKSNFYEIEIDREVAIKRAIKIANKNDIVLIAGKGHEDYQVIGNQKIHLDDREIVRKFLNINSND
ncbi:MAG: UDP-N-acetylmuramoyl-L-alanyl-D-glutamate--2,6-diaminopimelate ligase [Chlorobiota bacterium]|nr:UDP-N-acetylmuramoyl-L-alanyl-D-glutamate--2,6-diaminopimelate ligase [Chlorobiota bacterium]QQS66695.1 MAG: UDP-N-acetylmuramoyl-L-alanyl-D-glutamate--2,6-diaminopimelate ligase [Chlorobiota bacterium]